MTMERNSMRAGRGEGTVALGAGPSSGLDVWSPTGRIPLLILQGFVALTAIPGGAAMVADSLNGGLEWVIVPAPEYLHGSPFASYLIPGVLLGAVLGGVHLVAFLMLLRRHRWAHLIAAVAGFGVLLWIFVQMMFIPFSVLQAVYFGAGLAELVLVLLGLGVLRPSARSARTPRG